MVRKVLIIIFAAVFFCSCSEDIVDPQGAEKSFSFEVMNANVGSISSVTLNKNGSVAAWSGNTNDVRIKGKKLIGHIGIINSVKLSRDGRLLLSGSNDHNIKLWDVETGTLLRTFSEHLTAATDVNFSPDEKSVLSAEEKYIVYWKDAVSGFIGRQRMYGHTSSITSVEISNDMKIIISASYDRTLRIWNVENGDSVHLINAASGRFTEVKINPASNQFASGGTDSTINIWDLNNFNLIKTFKKDMGVVNSISYHNSGSYLASGGSDKKIYIWDLKADSVLTTLEEHDGSVTSLEFSSEGDDLISGGIDGKVIIWRNVFSKK